MSDEVNDLIRELESTNAGVPININDIKDEVNLSKEELHQFILNNGATLIKKSMLTIDRIKGRIESSGEAKDIEALAKLINAAAQSIQQLNKFADMDKKASANEIVPKQENTTNNYIIMTRDDMFKQAVEEAEKSKNSTPADTVDI